MHQIIQCAIDSCVSLYTHCEADIVLRITALQRLAAPALLAAKYTLSVGQPICLP